MERYEDCKTLSDKVAFIVGDVLGEYSGNDEAGLILGDLGYAISSAFSGHNGETVDFDKERFAKIVVDRYNRWVEHYQRLESRKGVR